LALNNFWPLSTADSVSPNANPQSPVPQFEVPLNEASKSTGQSLGFPRILVWAAWGFSSAVGMWAKRSLAIRLLHI